jgi:hypothetical protein
MLGDERIAGDVGGVQRVALGCGPPGRPPPAGDLDGLLTVVEQEGGQAGAEASDTTRRDETPAATRRVP